MTGSWFPRLSPDACHVAAGSDGLRVWLDDKPVTKMRADAKPGDWDSGEPSFTIPGLAGPQWASPRRIMTGANGQPEGIYAVDVWSMEYARVDHRGPNDLSAGAGWWAAWRPDTGIYQSDGVIRPTASRPAMHGASLAYTDHDRGTGVTPIRDLYLNTTLIVTGDVTAVRLVPGAVGYQVGHRTPCVWSLGQNAVTGIGDAAESVPELAYDDLGTLWVQTHDDQRLMLRPVGALEGYIVHAAETYYPHVAWHAGRRQFRSVWTDRWGNIAEAWTDPMTPRVDLRAPVAPAPVWHAAGTAPGDLLAYLQPSQDGLIKSSGPGQTLQEWVSAGALVQVKWGQPWAQERWLVDGLSIRLTYDATDGRYPRAWRLAPNNLWCRRDWRVGDRAEFPTNELIRRTEAGPSTREPFPYAVGLDAYGEHIDLGGDCGVCQVIVLTFAPHWPRSGYVEKNWYAIRESDGVRLGRVRYEEWREGVRVVRGDLTQIVTSPSVMPAPPLPIPDPPEVPTVPTKPPSAWGEFAYPRTISTAAAWTYTAHEPENGIRVTIRGEHARPTWIEWSVNGKATSRYTAQETRVVAESGPTEPPPVEPPVEPPAPPADLDAAWPASRVRQVRANFLALPGHGYTFMYPGHPPETRAAMRATMKAEGLSHLPFGIWGRYPGLPRFDYRQDVAGFRAILDECYADDLCPIVFLHTDSLDGSRWFEADVAAFWRRYLPQVADRIRCAALGWEWDQIDGEAIISGHAQLRLITEARRHLTSTTTLYGHWGPERWAGGPDRAGDYTDDEYAWWTEARQRGMTGHLANDNNPSLDAALDRLLRIPAPHGARPGIAGRLAYLGVDCVAFELSRGDYARWQAVRRAVDGHRDVQGWG